MSAPSRPPLAAIDLSSLRACFRAAQCAEGEAALVALERGERVDDARTPSSLTARECCPLCERAVAVDASSTTQRCAQGHALQRCWICFKLLPIHAWLCSTCGAGACAAHEPGCAPDGVLCDVSPVGVCGLCGTSCTPTHPYLR